MPLPQGWARPQGVSTSLSPGTQSSGSGKRFLICKVRACLRLLVRVSLLLAGTVLEDWVTHMWPWGQSIDCNRIMWHLLAAFCGVEEPRVYLCHEWLAAGSVTSSPPPGLGEATHICLFTKLMDAISPLQSQIRAAGAYTVSQGGRLHRGH